MTLHPCACGEEEFPWARHEMHDRPEGLVSIYLGACPRCGASRLFEFVVGDDPAPPPAFGRESPSQIVDPGEFLSLSHRASAIVADAAVQAAESPADVEEALDAATVAVAALEEVLKFVPAGADRVPASSFSSAEGRAMYGADPAQFDLVSLESLLRSRVSALRTLQGKEVA